MLIQKCVCVNVSPVHAERVSILNSFQKLFMCPEVYPRCQRFCCSYQCSLQHEMHKLFRKRSNKVVLWVPEVSIVLKVKFF